MKFSVTIAKDGTPYYLVEGDAEAGDDAAGARAMADALRDAFDGFKEGEQSASPKPDRFQVTE